jgi:hypothetical protein
MTAGAALAYQRDLIFPEGAALMYGIAVQQNPDWSSSRWRIVTLPPLCAVVGHLLAGVAEPPWVLEIAGVSAALVILGAVGSRLAPSLSAAVLPIVFGVHSWAYPAVVLLTCLVIAAWLTRRPAAVALAQPSSWPYRRTLGGSVAICGWIVIAGPLLALPIAALTPPVFVSAIEWLNADDHAPSEGVRRALLLVSAAAIGSAASRIAPAEWIAAPSAVALILLAMRLLSCWHAPALAVSLIPGIVGGMPFVSLTLGTAAGVGVLYLAMATIARIDRPDASHTRVTAARARAR